MFEPTLFIKWGPGAQEATPHYEDVVAGGLAARPSNRKRADALPLRLDAQGGLHLLSRPDAALLAFGADGRFTRRVALGAAGGGAVVDFAAAGDRYYLVVQDPDGTALVCVDAAGAAVWRRPGLDPGTDQVVLAPRSLFTTASAHPDVLTQLDPATGSPVRRHQLSHVAIRPFAAPDGSLVSATYFPKERRRGVLIYSPETGHETATIAEDELYGPLLDGFGVDAARQLHLYGVSASGGGASLFVVGSDAKLQRHRPLGTLLAPGPGLGVVTANLTGSRLEWLRANGGERSQEIDLPERLRSYLPDRLALVDADDERLVFDLRDNPMGSAADRVALRPATGAIEPVSTPGDSALVPGMQPLSTWQVGADGRMYVPVTSERGVTVVRITLP